MVGGGTEAVRAMVMQRAWRPTILIEDYTAKHNASLRLIMINLGRVFIYLFIPPQRRAETDFPR